MRSGKLKNTLVKCSNIVIPGKFLKIGPSLIKDIKNFLARKKAKFSLNPPLQTVNLYTTICGSPTAKNLFLLCAHAPGRHYPQFNFH